MKKIGIIVVVFLFGILVYNPPSVSAACDEKVYDRSKIEYTDSEQECVASGGCFQENAIGKDWCWPKDLKTEPASCDTANGWGPVDAGPDNLIGCPGFEGQCCKIVAGPGNIVPLCLNTETSNAVIRSCADIQSKAQLTPKNFCSPTYQYSQENNVCEEKVPYMFDLVYSACTGGKGINTAIGCIPTDNLPEFLRFIFKFALGAAAGVMLLMMIATGYQLMTSQGNPEKLAAARENVVSIFSGLILIVFSLVLLQTIGANILGLPGF